MSLLRQQTMSKIMTRSVAMVTIMSVIKVYTISVGMVITMSVVKDISIQWSKLSQSDFEGINVMVQIITMSVSKLLTG